MDETLNWQSCPRSESRIDFAGSLRSRGNTITQQSAAGQPPGALVQHGGKADGQGQRQETDKY